MVNFIKIPRLSNELKNVTYTTEGSRKYIKNLGEVSAGFPSPATDFVQNEISLDEHFLEKPEATYLIRVGGESMQPEYQLGDLLIVRSDLDPQHMDDIIVSINNSEYTFKRYDKNNKKLISLNPAYKDCIQLAEEDNALILGVVISFIRQKRRF